MSDGKVQPSARKSRVYAREYLRMNGIMPAMTQKYGIKVR
jgi:hypothetical protein